MKLIVDKILWGTLLLLFGPSVMVVASWNALPGDNLYGTKLALERAALTITSPSYTTASTLQIKYTERRYAEAKQLLSSKQSIQGLPYLESQIVETKKAIVNAPNKETQVALAKQYINTLSTVATELETQKQTITTSTSVQTPQLAQSPPTNPPTAAPTHTSDVKEVPTSETKKPTPTSTATPTPIQVAQVTTTTPISAEQAVVALQIDQTQQNITKTIDDLESLVTSSVIPGYEKKTPEQIKEERKKRDKAIEKWGTKSTGDRKKDIDDKNDSVEILEQEGP